MAANRRCTQLACIKIRRTTANRLNIKQSQGGAGQFTHQALSEWRNKWQQYNSTSTPLPSTPEPTIPVALTKTLQENAPLQPRAVGLALVSSKLRDGRTVLDRLRQQGSMKLLFPRSTDAALTGVMVNTAGGITGGDRFETTASVGAGCHMILTTQAAERAYRAQPGEVARVTNQITVGAQARMDWLPQETMLYQRSALRRSLRVDLAADARFLMVEPVIFGRAEMGEVLTHIAFHDQIDLRRADELLFADRTLLTGDAATRLQRNAIGAGCGAMASVLLVAPDAARYLAPARALMPANGGVSLIRDGVLFARLLAADGYTLRKTLVPLIEQLGATSIPRTWMI